jgi:hypothetical protein
MEEHPLIQSGVAPGVQIHSSIGNVLDVENTFCRRAGRGLSLASLRTESCRQNNSKEQNRNDYETAQLALPPIPLILLNGIDSNLCYCTHTCRRRSGD